MSPSSELNPRCDIPARPSTESPSRSKINGGKRGALSSYRTLSSQLPPRFWDVYHIRMSPSSELNPWYDVPAHSSAELLSRSNINGRKRGPPSSYRLSHFPPRLVTKPSLVDTNSRKARTAKALRL